ncbi:acyltransferase family protein [Salinivibrio costicola]|uniref:acyltransferase family protein n=1 Tax=Salinivibrio costicola TaxID=51367 RepID=UPI0004720E5E|nr:acyltransferase family protein [Salinivibrio costicola]
MNRNFLLDVVRIFATALVVVAHVGQRLDHWVGDGFGISNFYFVSLGGLAVSIFIILSGVVLMIGKPPSSYWSFLRKRLQRIYPTYWICLFIAVLIKVAYLLVTDSEGLFSNGGWLWNISLSVTGFYAFAGEWGGPFTATSWYIGLIVSLYLMFPFLRSMIVKAPFVTIITTFVVTLVVRLIIGGYFENSYRMLDWFPLVESLNLH